MVEAYKRKQTLKYIDTLGIFIMICLLVILISVFFSCLYQQSVGRTTMFTAKIVGVKQINFHVVLSLSNGTDITLRGNLPHTFVLNANYQITIFTNLNGEKSLVILYRIEGEL